MSGQSQAPQGAKPDGLLLQKLEMLEKQLAAQDAVIAKLVAQKPAMTPDTLWQQQVEQQQARKAELEKHREWVGQTCEQRTQAEADRRWPKGRTRYRVQLDWCPSILIWANSQAEAKGLYEELCGIRSTDKNYTVVEAKELAGVA